MKTLAFALSTLLLVAATPFATADDSASVTVTLQITLGNHVLAPYKECEVTVPAGSDPGDVLDQAEAQGCIDSWDYDVFDGFGRYVTCIDGICQQFGTFWAFYVDEVPSNVGIDGAIVENGQTIEFVYADWFTPFTVPL